MYLRKDKSNYQADLFFILLFFVFLAVFGVYTFGLQSATTTFVTLASFLVAMLIGFRAALLFIAAWGIGIALLGYSFIEGHIVYTIFPDNYASTYSAWLIVITGMSPRAFLYS